MFKVTLEDQIVQTNPVLEAFGKFHLFTIHISFLFFLPLAFHLNHKNPINAIFFEELFFWEIFFILKFCSGQHEFLKNIIKNNSERFLNDFF